jgi:hypothetical protein
MESLCPTAENCRFCTNKCNDYLIYPAFFHKDGSVTYVTRFDTLCQISKREYENMFGPNLPSEGVKKMIEANEKKEKLSKKDEERKMEDARKIADRVINKLLHKECDCKVHNDKDCKCEKH